MQHVDHDRHHTSAPPPKEFADDRLAATLRRIADSQHIVGMTIAVVRTGEPTWTMSKGHADLASGRHAASDTAFPWFSMTKIVTATAVMQLVEQGVLDLDRPAADHLPALGLLRSRSGTPITVRHLLSHSSGLANPIPVRWVHPASTALPDPARFLDHQLRRHRRLRSEPGATGRYTNLGYLALGQIVAEAVGASFIDHIRRQILEPLGMADTYFDEPRANETTVYQTAHRGMTPLLRLALPPGIIGEWSGPWVSYRPFRVTGAAYGGLVGPATDAARFVRMHLDASACQPRLLDPATVAEMQAITTPGKPYDHGLGWYRPLQRRQGQPGFVEHLGGGLGVYNTVRIYPHHGLGVVIMSNTPGYDRDALLAAIVDSVT
jgi:CubicO group peptidase (beta-lactamase class C family)